MRTRVKAVRPVNDVANDDDAEKKRGGSLSAMTRRAPVLAVLHGVAGGVASGVGVGAASFGASGVAVGVGAGGVSFSFVV